MKIKVISVGKKPSQELQTIIDHYQKRLNKFCNLSWVYLTTKHIDSESSDILRQIDQQDYVILLDENGNKLSSIDFAKTIELAQNNSLKQLVFVIGGAYGVNHSIFNRSNLVISLSDMVFPHQLVRLILTEQIYRAYTILSGSKYHHN